MSHLGLIDLTLYGDGLSGGTVVKVGLTEAFVLRREEENADGWVDRLVLPRMKAHKSAGEKGSNEITTHCELALYEGTLSTRHSSCAVGAGGLLDGVLHIVGHPYNHLVTYTGKENIREVCHDNVKPDRNSKLVLGNSLNVFTTTCKTWNHK